MGQKNGCAVAENLSAYPEDVVMPIRVSHPVERLSQDSFQSIAHEIVGLSFEIHNDLGRLFEEESYRKELKGRIGSRAQDEVEIVLSFDDFRTSRFIDLVVEPGGIFELKTTARIADAHRAQLVNYLFLTDSQHGKIINFRPQSVEHEFVNAKSSRKERTSFAIEDHRWKGCPRLRRQVEAVLRDWGTGLCMSLYDEVALHLLGELDAAETNIPVLSNGRSIGSQKVRLAAPDSILKITTLEDGRRSFELHARRFLQHTAMKRIDWINIARNRLAFQSLEK